MSDSAAAAAKVGGSSDLPTAAKPAQASAKIRIDRASFPDQPRSANKGIPATFENFQHLIEEAGITTRFNLVKKRAEIVVPGLAVGRQNRDAVILSHLESLCIAHTMSPGQARQYLLSLADAHPFDPFAAWIDSKPWDGTSRLAEICQTVEVAEDYPAAFKDVLIRKWLLSIVAATYQKQGFHARGVLTFQGAQGLGKTSWIANLVTPPKLREDVVKLGHSWDGGSKDARLTALAHRIVEWGELESSFRRELSGLKAFITETVDKIRPPYARVDAEYQRSTVFAASVNDGQFLLDNTGNTRFWTIAAQRIDYQHSIDMQQVFAELKVQFEDGQQWWLTPKEEHQLTLINNQHRVMSSIEARIQEELDLDRLGKEGLPRLTATQILRRLGFEKPTNPQFKEANVALRALLGDSKRSKGVNYWRVPWKIEEATGREYDPEAEIY